MLSKNNETMTMKNILIAPWVHITVTTCIRPLRGMQQYVVVSWEPMVLVFVDELLRLPITITEVFSRWTVSPFQAGSENKTSFPPLTCPPLLPQNYSILFSIALLSWEKAYSCGSSNPFLNRTVDKKICTMKPLFFKHIITIIKFSTKNLNLL